MKPAYCSNRSAYCCTLCSSKSKDSRRDCKYRLISDSDAILANLINKLIDFGINFIRGDSPALGGLEYQANYAGDELIDLYLPNKIDDKRAVEIIEFELEQQYPGFAKHDADQINSSKSNDSPLHEAELSISDLIVLKKIKEQLDYLRATVLILNDQKRSRPLELMLNAMEEMVMGPKEDIPDNPVAPENQESIDDSYDFRTEDEDLDELDLLMRDLGLDLRDIDPAKYYDDSDDEQYEPEQYDKGHFYW